jgi:hypothetical protein
MSLSLTTTKTVNIGNVPIGGDHPLALIAGPCVIESERQALETAEKLKRVTGDYGVPFIFKASYDKANRSSIDSFRGPGLHDGLKILQKIRAELDIPVLSDIHKEEEIGPASGGSRRVADSRVFMPANGPAGACRPIGQTCQHQKRPVHGSLGYEKRRSQGGTERV